MSADEFAVRMIGLALLLIIAVVIASFTLRELLPTFRRRHREDSALNMQDWR